MRHLRLRQVLNAQGFTGKEYREAIAFEKRNWKEDNMSLPTIGQVRKMHETLGSWDKHTEWLMQIGLAKRGNVLKDRCYNVLHVRGKSIRLKANYKPIKEANFKEQERRTIEFFETMGV
jgi:hypothetical protein